MIFKPDGIPKQMKYYKSMNVSDLIFEDKSQLRPVMEELGLQGQWLAKSIAVEK